MATASAWIGLGNSALSSSLMDFLKADSIVPGSNPSYQLCKTIYLDHPLGGKMTEGPVSLAQSQKRDIAIQQAPDEVLRAFEDEWEALLCDAVIHNLMTLSRVYGLATMGIVVENDKDTSKPLKMDKLWSQNIGFNVWDPLNTSGSLIMNQIPTAFDFNKPNGDGVTTNGQGFHRSRVQVMMNENPVYLNYNSAGFGFVGRSVYQRALFPLKSFVQLMIADDMISKKLGLIIAKQKSPGSVANRLMQFIAGIKRNLLKHAVTNNVMTIDVEEEVTTFDMTNTDTAGTYARTNIIRNCETAGDMPAKMLDQETLSSGLADGSEDARIIARYIERIRMKMNRPYRWMDNIVQYRAWSPEFYERMRVKYKKSVPNTYEDAFSQWRQNFSAAWPSLLIEPPSEKVKTEQVKLQAVVSIWETLLDRLDPENAANLIQDGLDNVNSNKQMFATEFGIDTDALLEYLEQKKAQADETHDTEQEATGMGAEATMLKAKQPAAKGLPKLGAVK